MWEKAHEFLLLHWVNEQSAEARQQRERKEREHKAMIRNAKMRNR